MSRGTISILLKIILALGIIGSIAYTYYVKMVLHEYEVFINDDGLPTLDE